MKLRHDHDCIIEETDCGDKLICQFDSYFTMSQDWEHYGSDEMVKYGNLFIAAPDLLHACKETLAEMRAYNPESEFDESCPSKPIFDLLKSAVAKAEGREV